MITTAKETRRILADMSVAEKHPATLQRPEPGSPATIRTMHSIHLALIKVGRLANRNLERKIPSWPVRSDEVSVLGYGQEKIAYRVSSPDETDRVVSVYHRGSLGKRDPFEVAKQKQELYHTHREYFGSLIVPTAFVIIDNPWGDGRKPASVAPYLAGLEHFSGLSNEDIKQRANAKPKFAADLGQLEYGYHRMLSDGLVPDLADSNVLVSGDGIRILDTGTLYYGVDKLSELSRIHGNYKVLDELAAHSQ